MSMYIAQPIECLYYTPVVGTVQDAGGALVARPGKRVQGSSTDSPKRMKTKTRFGGRPEKREAEKVAAR